MDGREVVEAELHSGGDEPATLREGAEAMAREGREGSADERWR